MSNAVLLPLLAVVGLFAGSFGGMAVNRIPDKTLRLFSPGPRCVHCEHRLALRDMVPVLSWIALGRTCRSCGGRITWAYPVLEIAMAAAFVIAGLTWGATWTLLPVLLGFWTLLVASVIDLYIYIIPNKLILPMLGVSFATMAVLHLAGVEAGVFRAAVIGMFAYFGLLAVPFFAYPAGLGFGDVKMALNMGLLLGWVAPAAVEGLVLILWALLIGSLLGVVMGVVLKLARKRGYDPLPDPLAEAPISVPADATATGDTAAVLSDVEAPAEKPKATSFFPFGPALAVGCMTAAVFADSILVNAGG